MKKTFLILCLFILNGVYAQNNRCNFTLDIQGDFMKDSTYRVESYSFAGIKPKHHRKLLTSLDIDYKQTLTLNVAFFQEFLGVICQYKKHEISEIKVNGSQQKIQLLIIYKKIIPAGKSKT